jgi:hypothetical protein
MKKRVTARSARTKERDLNERRSPNEKFTPAQIIAALELSAGVYMGAAQKLGCARTTIANYVERYADVRLAHERILEERLDLAETVLVKTMANHAQPNLQLDAVKFYLKTKGRQRGYVERGEVAGATGEPIAVAANVKFDLSALSEKELAVLDRLLGKAEAATHRATH